MRPGILSHVHEAFATPIATRLNLLGYAIEATPLSSHAAIESQAL